MSVNDHWSPGDWNVVLSTNGTNGTYNMASTRSKSSSSKIQNTKAEDSDLISLNMVKELLKVQESTIMNFFQIHVENTNKRIDNLIRDVQDIKNSLEFSQVQVEDLVKFKDKESSELKDQIKDTCSQFAKINASIIKITQDLNEAILKVDDLENRSRRNNLCFDGIPEDKNETWMTTEHKIKQVLTDHLDVKTEDFSIERAHRVGKVKSQADYKPRTVIAKFLSYKTREQVLNKKKLLKGKNIFIREDFSDKIQEKRRELIPQMYEARRNNMIAFLRYDKLITRPRMPTVGNDNDEG